MQPRRRVPVYSVYRNTEHPPLALGMIVAFAKSYKNGLLNEHYEFIPGFISSLKMMMEGVAEHGPGIFLCSDYLWSSEQNWEISKFAKQQQSQRTTSGIIFSTSENRETFTNHGVGGSPDRINDIEAESANGRPDSSSEQGVWRFGSTASTDHINPYPLEQSSSTDEAQGKQRVEGATVFEMKVL